jgi:hypothetical protein
MVVDGPLLATPARERPKFRVRVTAPNYAQHRATRNNAAREPRKRLKGRKFGNKFADFQRRIGLVIRVRQPGDSVASSRWSLTGLGCPGIDF